MKFIIACPSNANMSLKEKEEKNACLFFVSAYMREESGVISFSKNLKLKHSKVCCKRLKRVPVRAAMGIVAPLLRSDTDRTPREAGDNVLERCGIELAYHTCGRQLIK